MFSLAWHGAAVAGLAQWRAAFGALGGAFIAWQALAAYDSWIDDPAVRRAALKGYVLEVEKTAAQALAKEQQRQSEVAKAALVRLRTDLELLTARYKAEDLQNAIEITEYQKRLASLANRIGCGLSQSDVDWLRRKTPSDGRR